MHFDEEGSGESFIFESERAPGPHDRRGFIARALQIQVSLGGQVKFARDSLEIRLSAAWHFTTATGGGSPRAVAQLQQVVYNRVRNPR